MEEGSKSVLDCSKVGFEGFLIDFEQFLNKKCFKLVKGPHNLIDREVVIVTINYRLGVFGFLSMGTKEVPGNAGMKDQVMALKWVQRNIKHFGGDENKVTIAGYSAGGFSVSSHLASEMSKGLFHRAIAMSGAITTAMPLKKNNLELAEAIGVAIGCLRSNLLHCLMKVRSQVFKAFVMECTNQGLRKIEMWHSFSSFLLL
jgi:acetylcholinesterase